MELQPTVTRDLTVLFVTENWNAYQHMHMNLTYLHLQSMHAFFLKLNWDLIVSFHLEQANHMYNFIGDRGVILDHY